MIVPFRKRKVTYETSVFLNCPFDDEYLPIFRALVFALEFCGYASRCALESDDASISRIEKIKGLIRDSRFGIHDLSRIESNDVGLPRFNMPLELGVFLGFKWGGSGKQKRKRALVLAHKPYLYQQYISDISGQDIRDHGNDPEQAIRQVRSWLETHSEIALPFGGHFIVNRFRTFRKDLPRLLKLMHKTEADLDNFRDYHEFVWKWIGKNSPPPEVNP